MKILVADPANNITVFVLEYDGNSAKPADIARAILAEKSLGAEQVGFVIPPGYSAPGPYAGLWRLEMAGGEFCGNAARSFGLYVARLQELKGWARVFVSVSGAAAPVLVEANVELGRARAEMPKPAAIESLVYKDRSLPVLVFEGITHIIAPDLEAGRDTFFAIKSLAEEQFSAPGVEAAELGSGPSGPSAGSGPSSPAAGSGQSAFSALGVMFYDTASRFLRPAVYVRSTDSLVFESSCGSGSAALGVWLNRDRQEGTASYGIAQPGGLIETEVVKKAGKITGLTIGGKVKLGEPVQFSLPS